MNATRMLAVLATVALVAVGVWLGVAQAGGKAAVKAEKGVHWASITSSGTVYAGDKDVVSAQHVTTGDYVVVFKKAVGKCATVATANIVGPTGVAPNVNYGLGAVEVATYTNAGAAQDRNFSLIIDC